MFNQGEIIHNRYEIIDVVGSGGMSVVYRARCHVLNRYVAIKVLKPEFSEDRNFVTKFRVEAQAAAGLSHPNIVNVYDVGEDDGIYYIVMELVEGITLKEYIQHNGRMPYQKALDFLIQIASGIEVAHEHHTIHRDIKPQNIIVSNTGTLKVTDFGIARAASSNTIASNAMGSVHYISPEQARGGFSDERSDIYSLGITFYEMLTGRVPFQAENNVTVALMHIKGEMILPREYYPDIPMSVEKIVLKATQKKPERRYLTMNALIADLKRVYMDPRADVVMASMMPTDAPTIEISEDELSEIKNGAHMNENGLQMFPVSRELDEANQELENMFLEQNLDDDYDFEEVKEKPSKKEAAGAVDPKLQKIITISAIVATVIIAIILIVLISAATGWFKFGKKDKQPATEEVQTVSMINVLGLSEEEAIEKLEEAGISYKISYEYSDTVEEGFVMLQSEEEGALIEVRKTVKIVVSQGAEMVTVPNLIGKEESEAETLLEEAGFKIKHDYAYSDDVEKDYVIEQTPDGGQQAEKGSIVTIVISSGKEIKLTAVPDLKGKTVIEAESALRDKDLILGKVTKEYSEDVEEGKVISQSIRAGTEIKEGEKVDITISKGKEPKDPTYSAIFEGKISNVNYEFEDGEKVTVKLVLKIDGASYDIINAKYSGDAFPINVGSFPSLQGLKSKKGTPVWTVTNSVGADVTGNFTSNATVSYKLEE